MGGGRRNRASGERSVVTGGYGNLASGFGATISGGQLNQAVALAATVGGGLQNRSDDDYSTIGGGQSNVATGHVSTVGGGRFNSAWGGASAIGGGLSAKPRGALVHRVLGTARGSRAAWLLRRAKHSEKRGPGVRTPEAFQMGPRELRQYAPDGSELRKLERDAQDRWWQRVIAFGVAPDASTLAVLGDVGRLSVFDGNGAHGRLFELPGIVPSEQVAASRDWIAICDSQRRAFLLALADGSVHDLELEGANPTWRWGFAPDGRELWGVEVKSLTLHRFQLP